jgi:hypothetical protein
VEGKPDPLSSSDDLIYEAYSRSTEIKVAARILPGSREEKEVRYE